MEPRPGESADYDASALAEHDAALRVMAHQQGGMDAIGATLEMLNCKPPADEAVGLGTVRVALDAYVQEKVAEARRDEIQAFEDAFMRTEVYDFCQKRRKLLPPSPSGDRGGAGGRSVE